MLLAGYLTSHQIETLVYKKSTLSWAREDLRNLYDWKWLDKRVVKSGPDVYFLDFKSWRHFEEQGMNRHILEKVSGVKGSGKNPNLYLPHDLTLSALYTSAVLECRKLGLTLKWQNARMLEVQGLGVRPDGKIAVGRSGRTKEAFIEYTDRYYTKVKLQARLEAYSALWEGVEATPILWFVSEEKTLNVLIDELNHFQYRDYIFLAIYSPNCQFITEPVFLWSESERPVPWVTLSRNRSIYPIC